jgi:hypothetical protein
LKASSQDGAGFRRDPVLWLVPKCVVQVLSIPPPTALNQGNDKSDKSRFIDGLPDIGQIWKM